MSVSDTSADILEAYEITKSDGKTTLGLNCSYNYASYYAASSAGEALLPGDLYDAGAELLKYLQTLDGTCVASNSPLPDASKAFGPVSTYLQHHSFSFNSAEAEEAIWKVLSTFNNVFTHYVNLAHNAKVCFVGALTTAQTTASDYIEYDEALQVLMLGASFLDTEALHDLMKTSDCWPAVINGIIDSAADLQSFLNIKNTLPKALRI